MLSKRALTCLVVVVLVLLVLGARAWQKAMSPVAPGPRVSGRSAGLSTARIKIVEFTDFQCSACANASRVVHRLLKENDGKLFLELKYFPLPFHKNSRKAAAAAECAREQGKFWPMHDLLFRDQSTWAILDAPDDNFLSLARTVGLNDQAMMRCLASAAVEHVLADDVAEGKKLHVGATPTFFINDTMVVGAENLEKALKGLLP